jgi:hypothetical protein
MFRSVPFRSEIFGWFRVGSAERFRDLVIENLQVNRLNVERVNSSTKAAPDPNMDHTTLSRRVFIEKNQEVYPVSIKKVRAKYFEKYGTRLTVCLHHSIKSDVSWCVIVCLLLCNFLSVLSSSVWQCQCFVCLCHLHQSQFSSKC